MLSKLAIIAITLPNFLHILFPRTSKAKLAAERIKYPVITNIFTVLFFVFTSLMYLLLYFIISISISNQERVWYYDLLPFSVLFLLNIPVFCMFHNKKACTIAIPIFIICFIIIAFFPIRNIFFS